MRPLPAPEASGELPLLGSFVYYAWDREGDLLYVGVADGLAQRITEHYRAHAAWIRKATRLTWERYATRPEAERVETHQIVTLMPAYNLRDNGRRQAAARMGMRFLHDQDSWQRLGSVIRAERGGRTQKAVAQHAGISADDLRALERAGRQRYPRDVLKAVEDALGWHKGSVEAVLSGGEPRRLSAGELVERTIERAHLIAAGDRL